MVVVQPFDEAFVFSLFNFMCLFIQLYGMGKLWCCQGRWCSSSCQCYWNDHTSSFHTLFLLVLQREGVYIKFAVNEYWCNPFTTLWKKFIALDLETALYLCFLNITWIKMKRKKRQYFIVGLVLKIVCADALKQNRVSKEKNRCLSRVWLSTVII